MLASDDDRLKDVPKPGEVLADKYEIERVLGAGGMGVVLAARHVTLGQRVAIKMLLPEVAKLPESSERFLREARASTTLRSEHVARVLDVGQHANGAPFMVMEYLEGKDLQALAKSGGPLSISAVAEYVLQAAEALAEAHAAGIVHRDLKPANLFLSTRADGSPLIKVLDFGISKATQPGERGITRTDAVMGSPGYMSPEQIRSAKHVDQRADVWGLGVVLYELLTARPPFDGDNVAALSVQIVLEAPKPVRSLRPEVPEALSDVVRRCLEKEPAQRFQNMAELAAALAPFAPPESAVIVDRIKRIGRASVPYAATISAEAAASSSTAATIAGWEQSKQTSQRRAILLGVAGLALSAVILGGVFALGRRSAAEGEPSAAPAARAPAESAAREAATPAAPPSPSPAASADETAPSPAASPAPSASEAVPSSTPSASPSASEASPQSAKPRRVAAPKESCPKGQKLSNGHCCPVGMVWQNGACDRPLATSLP